MTLLSRVFGFVRDVMIARYAGAGPIADAFFVAFRLPNFFRSLFAEGAFNAAFVPSFTRILRGEGDKAARAFAEEALAVLLPVLAVFTIAAQLCMPWIIPLLAPGFDSADSRFALSVEFTIITFPYLLFISLVSLQGGILNGLGRFGAVAFTPVLLNLTMIMGLAALTPFAPTAGHALAISVWLAGVTQFLWLVWASHRVGFGLALRWPRLTPQMKDLLRLIGPASLGAGAAQINLLVGTALASLLPTGAISALFYADRLNQLPVGVIGVALGTALLPVIARHAGAGEEEAANGAMNRALEIGSFFALPSALALFVLAEPIMQVLFERGAFDRAASQAAAAALMAYALGLPAMVLVKAFAPGFHGRRDTRTPMRFSIIAIGVNISLSLILMWPFGHVGLALAGSFALWVNAALLGFRLHHLGHWRMDGRLRARSWRLMLAACLMAAVAWGVSRLAEPWIGAAGELRPALALAVIIAAGGLIYGLAVLGLGALRLTDLKALGRKTGG